jgi:cytochrome b
VHVTLGYTMAGLVGFRVVWGLLGTRHARFVNFVRGPAAVADYVRSVMRGRPQHYAGHNPAGAVAIIALLGLTVAIAASGWAAFNEIGGAWIGGAHEFAANAMAAVVGIHLAGVLVSSALHRENLIGAMISGRKPARPHDAAQGARVPLAALLLAAVLGFWCLQWQVAPPGAGSEASSPEAAAARTGAS